MLSIEQCIKILNKYEDVRYSNDEIRDIRDFLYDMARLQIETYNRDKDEKMFNKIKDNR